MTDKTIIVDGIELKKNIQKTLAELKQTFDPSKLTKSERDELKSDIQKVEDLAKEILNKS